MPQINSVWRLPKEPPPSVRKQLDTYPAVFQSILYQRGITTAEEALGYLLPGSLDKYEKKQLRQIDTACDLIKTAVENQKQIVIFGDYDADGITGSAILTTVLKKISAKVTPLLPNRFISGYGLNIEAVQTIHAQGGDLLITVDNGIRSHHEIDLARSLGMQTIVTDHHTCDDKLPNATAVLNPKAPDDPYPNKHLSGVGVVYKFIHALKNHFPTIEPDDYLDLVAIGTIADVVPLIGENRALVSKGLHAINNPAYQRQSIISILGTANLLGQKIRSADISFQIAPRINSSGRLDIKDFDTPLKLLLSTSTADCGRYAQMLENHNHQRKTISNRMLKTIKAQIDSSAPAQNIIFSFERSNHIGVAGITAGKLARTFYLPTVIGHKGADYTIASCRSIPQFNLIAALTDLSDLFERYGGHQMAAGFTIRNDRLPILKSRLSSIAETKLSKIEPKPVFHIDAVITLDQINQLLLNHLEKIEPTGQKNPPVIFMSRNLNCVDKRFVGKESDHLKMLITNGVHTFSAIGFGLGKLMNSFHNDIDIVYQINENHFRGNSEIQLQLLDVKPSS